MFPFLDTHPGGGLPISKPSNEMWMADWANAGQDHRTHRTRERATSITRKRLVSSFRFPSKIRRCFA
jgi:hypothetical protein